MIWVCFCTGNSQDQSGAYMRFYIGASYPKALGHNDGNDEPMPVEGKHLCLHATRGLYFSICVISHIRKRQHAYNDSELHTEDKRPIVDHILCVSLFVSLQKKFRD